MAALELQTKIAELMDRGHYVAVASLDLSSAFDVINIDLLLTRMKNMGIALDEVDLTSAGCLTDPHMLRSMASALHTLKLHAVQSKAQFWGQCSSIFS